MKSKKTNETDIGLQFPRAVSKSIKKKLNKVI